jgi:hypothetical protein
MGLSHRQVVHIWWGEVYPKEQERLLRFMDLNSQFPEDWATRLVERWVERDGSLDPALQRLGIRLGTRALDPIYPPEVGDGVSLRLGDCWVPATVVHLQKNGVLVAEDTIWRQRGGRQLFVPGGGKRTFLAINRRGHWRISGALGSEMVFGRRARRAT